MVDMGGSFDKEIWEVIERLSRGLPQDVQEKTVLRFSMKRPWAPIVKMIRKKSHQPLERLSYNEF